MCVRADVDEKVEGLQDKKARFGGREGMAKPGVAGTLVIEDGLEAAEGEGRAAAAQAVFVE